MKVLKNAAKTRRVAAEEILSALSVLENAKLDPSGFLETLGGSESPGRTWMLIFTSEVNYNSFTYVMTKFNFCLAIYVRNEGSLILVVFAETIEGWSLLPYYSCSAVRCCCKPFHLYFYFSCLI